MSHPLESTLAQDFLSIAISLPANGSSVTLGSLLTEVIADKGARTIIGVKLKAPSRDWQWSKPGQDPVPELADVDWLEPIAERILEAEVESADGTPSTTTAVIYLR